MSKSRTLIASVVATCLLAAGVGSAAAAGPVNQTGLVNVSLGNLTVQVPIAVAANVCGVQVGALSALLAQGQTTTCSAAGSAVVPDYTISRDGGGPVNQAGLVNVAVGDVTLQLPVAVAANICGVQAAVLAVGVLQDGTTTCTAKSSAAG